MVKYNNILERFFNVEVQLKKLNTVQCLLPPALPKHCNITFMKCNFTIHLLTEQSGNKNIKIIFLHQSKFYFLNAISSNFCTSSHSGCISFLSFLYLSSAFPRFDGDSPNCIDVLYSKSLHSVLKLTIAHNVISILYE